MIEWSETGIALFLIVIFGAMAISVLRQNE